MKKSTFAVMLLLILLLFLPFVLAEENKTFNLTAIPTHFSSTLDQPLSLHPTIEVLAKGLLGIKNSPEISTTLLVATICLWLFFFIILAETLEFTPFFNGKLRWVGAALITILIAVTGTIETIVLSLLSFGTNLWFFEKWSAGALTFTVVLLLIVVWFISRVLKWAKNYQEAFKAQKEGSELGAHLGFLYRFKEMFGFTKKD